MRKLMAALALALALAAISYATTVIPMSVEQLTTASSDVVLARAVDSKSDWNAEHTLIYTYTRFSVTRTLKGTAPNVITVRQMGGHAGGYTQKVSGVRYWAPGEEAVLFLQPSRQNDGTLIVTGLMQGNFRLTADASGAVHVSNGMPDVNAFDKQSGTAMQYRGARMTLDDLQQRVRKAQEQ